MDRPAFPDLSDTDMAEAMVLAMAVWCATICDDPARVAAAGRALARYFPRHDPERARWFLIHAPAVLHNIRRGDE